MDFTGPGWDLFATETARYAVDVLKQMLRNGTFTTELARKGIPFRPSVDEAQRLATDRGYRDSIIDWAVGEALEKFRDKGRAGTGWNPQGGALIRTWFTTGSMYEVINFLKEERKDAIKYHRAVEVCGQQTRETVRNHMSCSSDLAQQVVDQDVLREHLGSLSQRDRDIVWGRANKKTYKEIAAELGGETGRAIDRRWQWLKANHDWINRLDKLDEKAR
ncbi:MAG: hypothetical protein CL424_09750 [Acidimicrobiaceae bacterium]|nr:hypothetical protein [Acidimicrobiaceae bacterium]